MLYGYTYCVCLRVVHMSAMCMHKCHVYNVWVVPAYTHVCCGREELGLQSVCNVERSNGSGVGGSWLSAYGSRRRRKHTLLYSENGR